MKLRLLLIASINVLISQFVFSQTAYYDAYALKADTQITYQTKLQLGGKKPTIDTTYSFKDSVSALKILQPYTDSAGTGKPYNNPQQVAGAFSNNPFINTFFAKTTLPDDLGFFSSAVSSVGNANVTSFADGLAKLIVSRVKADLNTYFFQKMQAFISQKCPELKVLFPNTSLLLDNFASTDYSNVLNTLREAFDKDLHNILADIPNLDTLTTCYSPSANARIKLLQDSFLNTNVGRTFLAATTLGNGLLARQKFPDILSTMVNSYLSKWTDSNHNLQQSVRGSADLVAILSSSARSNRSNLNYVSLDSLNVLLKDSMARCFYLGLIWQQFYNHHDTIAAHALTDLVKNNANGAITYLEQIIQNGADLDSAVNSLLAAKRKGTSDLSSIYATLFESAGELLTAIQNIKMVDPALSFPTPVANIFSYGSDITDLANDIALKNYNAAIVSLQKYLSDIVAQGKNKTLDANLQNFIKYASFAANVVTAKSSDDVESAIEAVALPAESAVTQRNTNFSISINAYGGVFAGNEWMPTLKTNATAFSAGVTAPVGFAFTWGNIGHGASAKTANGKSFTLFVPLIDLGAMAAFRFQNDSANISSNVQLKNILAPGLYAYFGFGKCPISLGFGAQLGPQLRSVTATDVDVNKNYYIRYGLNLLVDIPLFNLFTK